MKTNWPTARLDEVSVSVTYGHTASATAEPIGPKFLRITDIQNGHVEWNSVPFCECDAADESACKLEEGDIVFARTGATTGKSFLIRHCPERAVFASYLIRVRPKKSIWPAYLAHFFQTPDYWRQIRKNFTGTAQGGVNASSLKGIELPLPPLPEQQRIGATMDLAEALRAKRRRALERIGLLTRSAFLDFFGDPVSNPKNLPTLSLGEIARFVGGGTPSRAVSAYYEGEICWATSKDMKGELLRDTQEHITERAIEESATNLVQPETILVVVKSKILMHRLPVLIAKVPTCFGQDLKGIILKQPWSSRYIARHLRLGQKWLLDRARGANTEGLTLDHLREFPVLVPPPALVERYDQIEQTIELQRERMSRSLTTLDALFASLQHRAFRGEL